MCVFLKQKNLLDKREKENHNRNLVKPGQWYHRKVEASDDGINGGGSEKLWKNSEFKIKESVKRDEILVRCTLSERWGGWLWFGGGSVPGVRILSADILPKLILLSRFRNPLCVLFSPTTFFQMFLKADIFLGEEILSKTPAPW